METNVSYENRNSRVTFHDESKNINTHLIKTEIEESPWSFYDGDKKKQTCCRFNGNTCFNRGKTLDGVIEMRRGVSPRKSPLKVVSTLKDHLGSFGRRFSMSTWFFTLLLLYSKCFGTGEGGTFAGLQHSPAVLLNRVGGRKHDGKCPGGELRLRAGLCSSLWC